MKKSIAILSVFLVLSASGQQLFQQASGIEIGKVLCFHSLSSGDVLVGSSSGLFRYSSGNIDVVLPASIHGVNDVAVDIAGNIWLATTHMGLVKINGNSIVQVFNSMNSAVPDEVLQVEWDNQYGLWFGTQSSLWRIVSSQPMAYPFPSTSAIPAVRNIVFDGSRTFFHWRDSIGIYNGTQFRKVVAGNFDMLANPAVGEVFALKDSMMFVYHGNTFVLDTSFTNALDDVNYPLSYSPVRNALSKYGNSYYLWYANFGIIRQYGFPTVTFGYRSGFFDFENNYSAVLQQSNAVFIGTTNGFLTGDSQLLFALNNQSDYIDLYSIRAPIFANGCLFNYSDGAIAYSEIPKGSGKTPIYIAMPWLAGLDDNNQLHLATQRYVENGFDFFSGTISTTQAKASENFSHKRTWKISKAEIDYHISHWFLPNYNVPEAIQSWPGNGDPQFGEAPILAPFFDLNQNGFYEPHLGDYPLIRGDQAIYFIYNDATYPHAESGGQPLGVEIHAMAYVFSDASLPLLAEDVENSIFFHYTIINRSQNNYHDFKMGVFSDIDIGYSHDDLIGCDTLNEMYYGYNGDSYDEDGNGYLGYGSHPPALGLTFLSHHMESFSVYNNLSVSIPDYLEDPNTFDEYWNVLNGNFSDGTAMTYGGFGYTGTQPVKYMFPGDPTDSTQWSDLSAGNYPYDRRGVGIVAFDSLGAGQSVCLDFAYVFDNEALAGSNLDNVVFLKKRVGRVRELFFSKQYECLYYEHNFMQPQPGSYVDTIQAFVDTCLINPYLPVDTAWISNISVSGNMAYVDWVVLQQTDTFELMDVPYLLQSAGNQLFVLVISCNYGGRGMQTHLIYVNASGEASPEDPFDPVSISIYPNPAVDYFTIALPSTMLPEEVELLDVNGRVLRSYSLTTTSSGIRLQGIDSGIYFLRFTHSGESKTLILNRD